MPRPPGRYPDRRRKTDDFDTSVDQIPGVHPTITGALDLQTHLGLQGEGITLFDLQIKKAEPFLTLPDVAEQLSIDSIYLFCYDY